MVKDLSAQRIRSHLPRGDIKRKSVKLSRLVQPRKDKAIGKKCEGLGFKSVM